MHSSLISSAWHTNREQRPTGSPVLLMILGPWICWRELRQGTILSAASPSLFAGRHRNRLVHRLPLTLGKQPILVPFSGRKLASRRRRTLVRGLKAELLEYPHRRGIPKKATRLHRLEPHRAKTMRQQNTAGSSRMAASPEGCAYHETQISGLEVGIDPKEPTNTDYAIINQYHKNQSRPAFFETFHPGYPSICCIRWEGRRNVGGSRHLRIRKQFLYRGAVLGVYRLDGQHTLTLSDDTLYVGTIGPAMYVKFRCAERRFFHHFQKVWFDNI